MNSFLSAVGSINIIESDNVTATSPVKYRKRNARKMSEIYNTKSNRERRSASKNAESLIQAQLKFTGGKEGLSIRTYYREKRRTGLAQAFETPSKLTDFNFEKGRWWTTIVNPDVELHSEDESYWKLDNGALVPPKFSSPVVYRRPTSGHGPGRPRKRLKGRAKILYDHSLSNKHVGSRSVDTTHVVAIDKGNDIDQDYEEWQRQEQLMYESMADNTDYCIPSDYCDDSASSNGSVTEVMGDTTESFHWTAAVRDGNVTLDRTISYNAGGGGEDLLSNSERSDTRRIDRRRDIQSKLTKDISVSQQPVSPLHVTRGTVNTVFTPLVAVKDSHGAMSSPHNLSLQSPQLSPFSAYIPRSDTVSNCSDITDEVDLHIHEHDRVHSCDSPWSRVIQSLETDYHNRRQSGRSADATPFRQPIEFPFPIPAFPPVQKEYIEGVTHYSTSHTVDDGDCNSVLSVSSQQIDLQTSPIVTTKYHATSQVESTADDSYDQGSVTINDNDKLHRSSTTRGNKAALQAVTHSLHGKIWSTLTSVWKTCTASPPQQTESTSNASSATPRIMCVNNINIEY